MMTQKFLLSAVDANNSIIDGNGLIDEGEIAKFRLTSNQPAPAGGIDVTLKYYTN